MENILKYPDIYVDSMVGNYSFENKYANRKAYIDNIVVTNSGTNKEKIYCGLSTGYYTTSNNLVWYQCIINNKLIFVPSVYFGNETFATTYKSKAQSILNKLIKNEIEIYQNLLLGAELLNIAERKGINVSAEKSELKAICGRYEIVQNDIAKYTTNSQTYTPTLITNNLERVRLDLDLANNGIGIATTTIIILSAVVTLVTSSLAWYVFYNDNISAKSDVKKSAELNKIIGDKLDDETKTALYDFIDKYAESYYKSAVRTMKGQNLSTIIKIVIGVGIGGFIVYKIVGNGR